MLEWLAQLGKFSPTVLYLGGVIYLYLQNQKVRDTCEAEIKALLERYHTQMGEQIHTLALINEQLEKK